MYTGALKDIGGGKPAFTQADTSTIPSPDRPSVQWLQLRVTDSPSSPDWDARLSPLSRHTESIVNGT